MPTVHSAACDRVHDRVKRVGVGSIASSSANFCSKPSILPELVEGGASGWLAVDTFSIRVRVRVRVSGAC